MRAHYCCSYIEIAWTGFKLIALCVQLGASRRWSTNIQIIVKACIRIMAHPQIDRYELPKHIRYEIKRFERQHKNDITIKRRFYRIREYFHENILIP